jgi:hypothetical protein
MISAPVKEQSRTVMSQLNANAPVLATVVAIELKPIIGNSCSTESIETFAGLLSGALALACSVQRFEHVGEQTAYTLVLPPETQTAHVLRRLTGVAKEFGQVHGEVAVRFVAHSGVVFPTGATDRRAYAGSAIRSAHSMLRRLPLAVDQAATREFVSFIKTLPSSPIQFSPVPGASNADELMALRFSSESAPLPDGEKASSIPVTDRAFGEFLTTRLAEDLGPFASVMVDSAQRLATTVEVLVKELIHEIESPAARQRFTKDVDTYLQQRAGNRDLQILLGKNSPKGKRK